MFARAGVLGFLLSACVVAETQSTAATPPPDAGPMKPQRVEPSMASSELAPGEAKVVAPPNEPPPAQPGTVADTQTRPQELTPRLADAHGPDADLFKRAEALRANGDSEGMRRVLLELVKNHPTSPFMPHAYVMFGDLFFTAGDMAQALQVFNKVLTYPDAGTGAYAQYMTGWCHVNLGADAEALAAFTRAAERAQAVTTDSGARLVRAGVLDSTLPYSRVGQLDRAPAFYAKVTRGTPVSLDEALKRLARVSIDGGRRDELARVCTKLGMPSWCGLPLDQP